jgi:SRSO17 transposase
MIREEAMGIASWTGPVIDWKRELAAFKNLFAPLFPRQELRETFGLFLDGLFSGTERKTAWLMAEHAGLERPYRMQSLLGRSRWNEEGLRDAVRDYVVETLGDRDGVLIVDETGFVKKGRTQWGWRGNIRAQPGGSRTPKWVCFWPMPAASARR